MNPTLWDTSVEVRCPDCQVQTRVDANVYQKAISSTNNRSKGVSKTIVCWNCGWRHDQPPQVTATFSPDEVVVEPNAREIRCGDLVVVSELASAGSGSQTRKQGDSGFQVKRVLAIRGQKVSVDPRGRLLVDEKSPIDFESQAWVVVHDAHQPGLDQDDSTRWRIREDGVWVYSHKSVYRGGRPSPILDDYPGNWLVDRTLRPADRLAVIVELPDHTERSLRVRGCWWTNDGVCSLERLYPVDPITRSVRISLQNEANQSPVGRQFAVDPNHPIAMSLSWEGSPGIQSPRRVKPNRLQIERAVVYRADDRQVNFSAITLGEDDLFLVGDNVPVSVDSRHFGPVHRNGVLGAVVALVPGKPTNPTVTG